MTLQDYHNTESIKVNVRRSGEKNFTIDFSPFHLRSEKVKFGSARRERKSLKSRSYLHFVTMDVCMWLY
jgi:hypothetical protein